MAVIATNLTEYADNGNSRTFVLDDHTDEKVRLVIQRRAPASGSKVLSKQSFSVIYGTEGVDGTILPQKYNITIDASSPVGGTTTDRTAMVAVVRDIVNSDAFLTALVSGRWIATGA